MPNADTKQAEPATRLLAKLPTADESAAAIREAARRLGLLLDLHRIAQRLREHEPKPNRSSS